MTITSISPVSGALAGDPFTVRGTLSGYQAPPTLWYQDDTGSLQPMPAGVSVTTTTFSFTHPGLTSGPHTISITDNNTSGNAVFDTEFDTFVTHRAWQTPDPWAYCATISPDGRGGPAFNERGTQWWVNPLNPSTVITNLYVDSGGILKLGVDNTPSANATYINGQAGATMPYVATLLNNQNVAVRLFGYYEFKVAVPKIQGFYFQVDLEDYPASTTFNSEINILIGTDGNGAQKMTLSFEYVVPSYTKSIVYTNTSLDLTLPHTYGLNWQSDFITLYIDNVQVYQTATNAFGGGIFTTEKMFAYMLTATNYGDAGTVAANPPPASLPAYASVDYFRIFTTKPGFSASNGDGTGLQAFRIADMMERFGVVTFSSLDANSNVWGSFPADYSPNSVIAGLNFLSSGSGMNPLVHEYHYAGRESIQSTWCPQVASATGARFSMSIGSNGSDSDVASMVTMAQSSSTSTGWFQWMDGLNEPNNSSFSVPSATSVLVEQDVQSACAGLANNAFPVTPVHASLIFALPLPDTQAPFNNYYSASQQTTVDNIIHVSNVHFYPPFQCDQDDGSGRNGMFNDVFTGFQNQFAGTTSQIMTEWHPTLFNTQGHVLDPVYDAFYAPTFILSGFRLNYQAMFWFAMLDYGTTYFSGLFPKTGGVSPRPVAYTIQAMYQLLPDTSTTQHTFFPGQLNISITGLPAANANATNSGGQRMLFQSTSGTFGLFLWNAQNTPGGATSNVTVTFNGAIPPSVSLYRISDASSPTAPKTALQTLTNPHSVTFPLDANVYELIIPFPSGTATSAGFGVAVPDTTTTPTDTFIQPNSGHIHDANGFTWTLDSSGLLCVDGIEDTTSTNTVVAVFISGVIWRETTSGVWSSKSKPSDASWAAGTNPVINIGSITTPSPATSFNVSGSLLAFTTAPTLTYQDGTGAAQALPAGSTVTATSYSFTHPGMPSGSQTLTMSVNGAFASTTYTVAASSWTSLPPTNLLTGTVTGLVAGTSYDVEVYATNTAGQSTPTPILTVATTGTNPGIPSAPTGLAAPTTSTTTVTLSWLAPATGSGPFTYQPQISPHGTNTWTNGPSTSSLSVQFTGLTASTSYDFRVSAANSSGTSPESAVFTASTLAAVTTPTQWNTSGASSTMTFQASGPAPSVTGSQNTGGVDPVISGPASGSMIVLQNLAITGVTVTDAIWPHAGNIACNIACTSGTVAVKLAGTPVSGSGTKSIAINDTSSNVQSELTTLVYTATASGGTDTVTVNVFDQTGAQNTLSIPITIGTGLLLQATSGGPSTQSATPQSCVSTTTLSTGKAAFQITMNALTPNFAIGLCNATFSSSAGFLGSDTTGISFWPSTAAGIQPAQSMFYNNVEVLTPSGTPSADVANDVMTVLVDRTAGLWWVQTPSMITTYGANAYNDSATADPSNGVGGVQIQVTGDLYICFNEAEGGGVAVLNAGSSAFVGTVPSSFPPWGGGVATAVAPGQVTGLTASSVAPTAITITWGVPTGTPPFTYTVSYDPQGTLTPSQTVSTTTATFTGLTASHTYHFTVQAANSAGTGTVSSTLAVTTPATTTAPGAPSGVQATGETTTSISYSWGAPTGTAPFTYQPQTRVTGTTAWTSAPTTSSTTATISSLTSNTSYDFQVSATNSVGTGPFSSPVVTVSTLAVTGGTGPAATSGFVTVEFSTVLNMPGVASPVVIPPQMFGVATAAACDNDFALIADGTFQSTASSLPIPLIRFNCNSGLASTYSATFPNGPNGTPNWTPWNAFINNIGKCVNLATTPIIMGVGFPDTGGLSNADFAHMTSQLVQRLRTTAPSGGGNPIDPKYWEYLNEVGSISSSGFNAFVDAVNGVAAGYTCLGPTSANDFGQVSTLISGRGSRTFIPDSHAYLYCAGADTQPTDANIAQAIPVTGTSPGNFASNINSSCDGALGSTIPFFWGEYNIECSAASVSEEQNIIGAMFVVNNLFKCALATNRPLWAGIWEWVNDGTYGLIQGSSIAPTGYVLSQMYQRMPGTAVRTTLSAAPNCAGYATKGSTSFGVVFTNWGGSAQSGAVALSHWPLNSTGNGTIHVWTQTNSNGKGAVTTVTVTNGVTGTVTIPSNSVVILYP